MSDLIDRDALKKAIGKMYRCDWKQVKREFSFAEVIDSLPSADPERKRGEWIVHLYSLGMDRYECSECEERCNLGYHFCPNCGTEMVGGYGKND